MSRNLASAEGLRIGFRTARGLHWAVDGIDLELRPGDRIGLIGASGSGKSLTARALLGLTPPGALLRAGRLAVGGLDITTAGPAQLRAIRGPVVGLVAQDPEGALNPVLSIEAHFRESLAAHGRAFSPAAARQKTEQALRATGLDPVSHRRAFPHQLSGGQRQRVAIALALALEPELLVADEPTASLDPLTREALLDLIHRATDAEDHRGLLFISHDIALVGNRTDRLTVMLHGRIVETGPTRTVLGAPAHPWTRILVDAATGRPAAAAGPGPRAGHGCRFAPVCPSADDECRRTEPDLAPVGAGHRCACHHPGGS